ncbi:hypothetical protein DDE82_007729 [Stemphylium lycopersici]|nr:hypothetical protein TW65_08154 [Stemphylium lycopersici]RAQ99998.1 hypothetical protein DDE82_007729 [Stemphylium lycopersici]
MHFTSAIAALAMLASTASAQLALDNVASFETYSNFDCSPQGTQQQNINSDTCNFLPGQSARVFFLEKTRGDCRRQSAVTVPDKSDRAIWVYSSLSCRDSGLSLVNTDNY